MLQKNPDMRPAWPNEGMELQQLQDLVCQAVLKISTFPGKLPTHWQSLESQEVYFYCHLKSKLIFSYAKKNITEEENRLTIRECFIHLCILRSF